jgi:hypothetical protein
VVYVLRARIRNTRAVGEILNRSDTDELRKVLRTVEVGHNGLPVYTAYCPRSEEAAGKSLANVVWTLNGQHAVKLQSMAVVLSIANVRAGVVTRSSTKGLSGSAPPLDLAKLTASFYEALRNPYMDEPGGSRKRRAEPRALATGGGQLNSLIPLPLFALENGTHNQQDLEDAWERLATWMMAIGSFFRRKATEVVAETHDMWLGALKTLLSELSDSDKCEERTPVCEKVRSILLHLLWKCCVESGSRVPTEIYEYFDEEFQDLVASVKSRNGRGAKRMRMHTSSDSDMDTDETMSDAEALGFLIEKYRFVQFLDVNWIQGCEFDVVVVCAPSVDGRTFKKHPKERKLHVWRSLSRTKLLSVVVLPAKNEEEANAYWPGTWHDWSLFRGM